MDEHIEIDVASRAHHAAVLGASRRPTATVLTLVIVCVLIAGGATALVAGLTKDSARQARLPVATKGVPMIRPAPCPPSGTETESADPTRVGRWPFRVIAKGTFGSVVNGAAGTVFAIEACGTDESDLRVVRISLARKGSVQASAFVHAALLTSSLVSSGGALYFGAARLDLAGPTSSPPYELTVYRLDPATMTFTASRSLGRGYGITLETVVSGIVAATGSSLLTVNRSTLVPRPLVAFGRSVAQHVVADATTGEYAVSLFTPAAVGPAAGARIELLEGRTGRVVSTASLPGGSDPQSLVVAGGRLWVAVGNGLLTTVRVYRLQSLTPIGGGQANAAKAGESAPENIALDVTGGVVWTHGLSFLGCISATSAEMLASTDQTGPAPVFVSQVFANDAALYALSPEGIGRLSAPAACSP